MKVLRARAVIALCLTLTLAGLGGGGGQASAAAARAPRVAAAPSDAQAMAALRLWMQRVVAWSQPYVAVQEEFVNWIVALGGDILTAAKYGDDPKAGAAWARDWAPAQHARLADLRARADALKGGLLPEVPPMLRDFAQTRIVTANLSRLPDALGRLIDETAPTLDALIDTMAQTASGDAAAAKRLPAEGIGLDIALAKASLNTPNPAAGIPNHPLSDLHGALQATWRADIAIEQAAQDGLSGKPVDRAAVSATLRAEAAKTEAAMNAAIRHTALMRRGLATMPDGAMKRGVFQALDSMEDTVKAYGEVVAVWRAVANTVDDPKSGPLDWIEQSAKVQGPLARISDQGMERRRMLAGAL
ncbi:MAG: hypothetical protein JWP35_1622 [Caulobacter sp.]|nr:hypothetical protein [Caulobacter sp.]